MSLSKKRKVDSECRVFNEKWCSDYFVTEHTNGALCLICNETIAVLKEYNIRRHYETKHSKSKYAELKGQARLDKIAFLKKSVKSQREIFLRQTHQNEASVRASFKICHTLAKTGKPFSDGELVKSCISKAVEELCPEKQSLFNTISLSANTVARRTEDISADITRQFQDSCKKFEYFSIALDESTDVSDSAQVLFFIRGINCEFDITEELADVFSMESNVTGVNIFTKVSDSVSKLELDFKKLKGITTDGGKSMCGSKTGLVGHICNTVQSTGGEKPMVLHCIVHQQSLCGKSLKVTEVMDVVVKTVNYIRSHSLKHRQFKMFLSEIESEYPDIPYHCEVRWLSRGKVLKRFFELRQAIDIFMIEQGKPVEELSNDEWIWKLAFLVDITTHLNFLNLKLQGKSSLVHDLFQHVKSFRLKLELFQKQLKKSTLDHFEMCKKFGGETSVPFPSQYAEEEIAKLKEVFTTRFADFDDETTSRKIKLFQNPFSCDVEDVPPDFQLELIELQTNENLKNTYSECSINGDLLPFYRSLSDEFKVIKDFARKVFTIFGSTYICEQTFSKMKYIKSKYRTRLTDQHLKDQLVIGTTKYDPDWASLIKNKQLHLSHSSH